MTTLTIEFPETVAKQVQEKGLSPQQSQSLIVRFVELCLAATNENTKAHHQWTDGTDFAKQIIMNNRDLFEELSKLCSQGM